MPEFSIQIDRAEKIYNHRAKRPLVALRDCSLNIHPNEFVSIVGPSGCGKSTLLLLAAGLERITAGGIEIEGRKVAGPDPECAIVFQDYQLFPWRTVRANVEFGLEIKNTPKAKRRDLSTQFIELVGLRGFEECFPHELSGGMKQRVAIARALVNRPRVLLMDEPFASVDALTREKLQLDLLQIWQEAKCTVVFVTHSNDEAVYLSDRVAIMSRRPGRIVEALNIPLARPRTAETFGKPEFFELRHRIKELVWREFQESADESQL